MDNPEKLVTLDTQDTRRRWQSRMDNPEKLVTLDTQDEGGNQEWTIQRNL